MPPETLPDRIMARTARVAVIGQGYVGLPLALAFADAGFAVSGLDSDRARVDALGAGRSPTPDVPDARLGAAPAAGRYRPTRDPGVLTDSDAIVICVPPPLRKSKDPDISFVVAAAGEVAARFRPGPLVVLESTTYPGTTEELLVPMFEARGGEAGRSVFLAFSPERIDGSRILVLGVAYRRGVGDTRESPALEVLHRLGARGAEIAYADPHVPEVAVAGAVLEAIEPSDEALAGADCVVVLTDHPEFDYARVVARARLVVDTRHATWPLARAGARLVTL